MGWKQWKAFWWDVLCAGHWNGMGFSLLGGTEFPGQGFAWKGICLLWGWAQGWLAAPPRVPSNPGAAPGAGSAPKAPLWLGWRVQHQGRGCTKPQEHRNHSLSSYPLQALPLERGSILRKSLVLRWGAALFHQGHSFAQMHYFNCFVIWKRLCVEMGLGPQSCDGAEFILSFLNAKPSQI